MLLMLNFVCMFICTSTQSRVIHARYFLPVKRHRLRGVGILITQKITWRILALYQIIVLGFQIV